MSLGLRLLAHLSSPALDSDSFLSTIEKWLLNQYAFIHPKFWRSEAGSHPILLCQLHPAAEDVELSLAQPDQLVVSANTTTVGPGYHMFLATLLKQLGNAIGAEWEKSLNESDEFGDETGYFFASDEIRLREEMTLWLSSLAGAFFNDPELSGCRDIALCLPMNPQFTSGSLVLTPMGPRDRDWLANTARDGHLGVDFFAWWNQGFTSEYFLNRARALMWTEVRWRAPIDSSEIGVLEDVADCLQKAYELGPTLTFPWSEWKQVLALLNRDDGLKTLLTSKADYSPSIGYRRNSVLVSLPGGWRIRVPGSFSEFTSDEQNVLSAMDPPREIWFTAYRFKSPSVEEFMAATNHIERSQLDLKIERHGYFATASISKMKTEKGDSYFSLKSSNISIAGRSVCTIIFPTQDQKEWALDTWRSLEPPPEPTT